MSNEQLKENIKIIKIIMKTYYLYILAERKKDKYFIDITDDLSKSVKENLNKLNDVAGKDKYILAYYEKAETVMKAISGRKKILKWDKVWLKILIENCNPKWEDLIRDFKIFKKKEL
jgi:predicted GIY-YIG superfamily endonuclease